MPLWRALLSITAIWSLLYLPGLGEPELRGEEMRRILPAQEMLASGDWIVPRIAGEVYSNKPPLINWAVAAMFRLTGSSSEFSARLVSALSVLALAIAAATLLRGPLSAHAAWVVGLVLLTAFSMISKGRLIEIEALYTALFGIAAFLWIRFWIGRHSPWRLWLLPSIFLGIACLLKGPVHLLFWFPFVGITAWRSRELRALLHPAQFAGIALIAAIFLPWVLLNLRAAGVGDETVGNWMVELKERGNLEKFEWSRWLTNPFRTLGGFLPWSVPLLYVAWQMHKKRLFLTASREDGVLFACLASLVLGIVALALIPLGVPRYLMPLYPLAAFATVALYFRLTPEDRERYEAFGRAAIVALVIVLVVAPPAMMVVASRKDLSLPMPLPFIGLVLTLIVSWLVLGPWKRKDALTKTALLLTAGALGIMPSMPAFQEDGDLFRNSAREIAALTPADGRIVFFADREVRTRQTRHLRLIYYLRQPSQGVGESGDLPSDTSLFVGRVEAEPAMREKLGPRAVAKREIVEVRGVPLVALTLAPVQ